MTPVDLVIREQLFLAPADTITIVGMGESRNLWAAMKLFFEVEMVDYDIKFREDDKVICKDIVFDDHVPGDIIVNYACEKMWPLGELYKGREFVLVGDDEHHNGDCNPTKSCEQLIEENNITEVFYKTVVPRWRGNYYIVHGIN